MPRTLRMGFVGADVIVLQGALNLAPPVMPPLLVTDGILGAKTLTRTKAFQRSRGLTPDGIVGPQTWGKLLAAQRPATPPPNRCACGSGPHHHGDAQTSKALAAFLKAVPTSSSGQRQAFSAPSSAASFAFPSLPSLPSLPKLRTLTAAERTLIDGSYGASIDYSTVVLSDKTGAGGRAFVVAVPAPFGLGPTMQLVNIGPSFTTHTMIHEMGHVWQSQHHSSATEYMVNAIASQAAAEAANLMLKVSTFSAYGYVPGRAFSEYGAEQLAQQVANGEVPIVAHVKSIAKGAVDPDLKLGTPRFEDTSVAGVKH